MFYLLHFWCSTLHSIKSAQYCLYNSGKGRCIQYMWSNDMFVLWNCISAIFYEDRKYALHIFPKQHTFLNIQGSQFLEFEWIPMLALLRSVINRRVSLLCNCCSAMPRKLYKRYWPYHGKHMKDWKYQLIKSFKLPNVFFETRLSMYWQNAFVKILLRTGLVGKDL